MSHVRLIILIGLLALCIPQTAAIDQDEQTQAVPPEHYISGVPFVGWGEAAAADYPNKHILNPSYVATHRIAMRYWGVPESLIEVWMEEEIPGLDSEFLEEASLEKLKRRIADDRPVIVTPAITAHAHYLYYVFKMIAIFGDPKFDVEQAGPTSGMFPEMLSIERFLKFAAKACKDCALNDSVFLAGRVVVGYDDERKILIIHDPVFGPDWEVSYEDFQRMWSFDDYKMWVPVYQDQAGIATRHPAEIDNAPRGVDHDAAFALFNGYSLAAVNRPVEAEAELRRGLALDGISDRYAHLLRVELGSLLGHTGRAQEAVRLLREAIDIFGDNFRAWGELGNVYKCCIKDKQAKRNAKTAYANAKKLCNEQTENKVAEELGRDFYVLGCEGRYLGWAGRGRPVFVPAEGSALTGLLDGPATHLGR